MAKEKLSRVRRGHTHTFKIEGLTGYIITGEYDDGRLGEVFIRVSKQGSTLMGIVDAWSIALNMGLQNGVPLISYVEKYAGMRFEPFGMTNDSDVRNVSSLVDYIIRRLALDYLSVEERHQCGVYTTNETISKLEITILEETSEVKTERKVSRQRDVNRPMCYTCGGFMNPSGSCHVCESCGSTSGCS